MFKSRMTCILKLIVLAACTFLSLAAFSDVLTTESNKNYYRLNILTAQDQLYISKVAGNIRLETLNQKLYNSILSDLTNTRLDTNYISKFATDNKDYPNAPLRIEFIPMDSSVELFSFYKEDEKKFILDFWKDKSSAPIKQEEEKKVETSVKIAKPIVKAKTKVQTKTLDLVIPVVKKEIKNNNEYRDFRYGAAFVWDYTPLLPRLNKTIDTSNKTPEFFYPIANRMNTKGDEKESHLQLAINLYKEAKWGLMYKSLKLYEQKYGVDTNQDFIEYLKANALIRSNFKEKNRGIANSANNILVDIYEISKNYKLKSAALKYLIQYHLDTKDLIQSLNYSKKLFVEAKKAFEDEDARYSATVIIHSLAELRQTDKIEIFLENDVVAQVLPPQIKIAYLMYAYLLADDTKAVIDLYAKNKKSFARPIHEAIIYNAAEAYFRRANYQEAIKLFDEFVAEYSYISASDSARIRIALAHDLKNDSPTKVLELYKNAIDKTSVSDINFEARVRYVGLRLARKYELDKADIETEVFLETDSKIDTNLSQLLWLVRLRTFINKKEYKKALTYLTGLPISTFKPADARTFEGDGAEIVFALIKDAYETGDYAQVISIWETYKTKYSSKVAMGPYVNFIVCNSYMQLNLNDSFQRSFAELKKLKNTEERIFPIWVERGNVGTTSQLLDELELIQLIAKNDYISALSKLNSIVKNDKKFIKENYYRGIIQYNLKNYKEADKAFIELLTSSKSIDLSQKEMAFLIQCQIETVYNLNDTNRFRTIANAMLKDLESLKESNVMKLALERVSYLLIESYSADANSKFDDYDKLSKDFIDNFPTSPYMARILYVRGRGLVKSNRHEEGKKLFYDLLENKAVPDYIKELSKTELSSLKLWSKAL